MWIAKCRKQLAGVLQTEFDRERLVTEREEIALSFVEMHYPQITQIAQKNKTQKELIEMFCLICETV